MEYLVRIFVTSLEITQNRKLDIDDGAHWHGRPLSAGNVKEWRSERAGRLRPLRDSYLSSLVCWAFDNIAADGRDRYVCMASQWRLGTTPRHRWNLIQLNGHISVLCSLSMMKKDRCWPHAIMKLGWIIHPLIMLWFSASGQVTMPLNVRPT